MPIIDDPRYTQSAVAGRVNSGLFAKAEAEQEPAVLEVLDAAARQSTLPGALYERVTTRDPDMPDAPAGWDPLDHIQGYEDHAADLADSLSPSELQGRINRIESQRKDKDVLRRAGLGGPGAEITMNLLDPSFLAAIAVPELALAKTARMGKALQAAAEGAVAATAYEGGMQVLQENRTATESLLNVGGGALLGGIIGSVGRVPKSELKPIQEAIAAELGSMRSTAGAAARMGASTQERESLAAGGKQMSKGLAKTPLIGTDLDRVMASDSVVAKQVLQELADVPAAVGKNLEGDASPVSVESFTAKHDARVADFVDMSKQQWIEYRKRVPKGQRMSEEDFYTAIASASRRGDSIGVPEVDRAAKYLRDRVFDPLKKDAMDLGLLDDPLKKAQEAAAKKAVDKYVQAEEKQIYTDYTATARSQILSRRDFRNRVKEAYTDPVDVDIPEIQDVIGQLLDKAAKNAARDQLEDATAVAKFMRRREISEAIGKAYEKYSARLEPLSLKKFRERVAKGEADGDANIQRAIKLSEDQQAGRLAKRVTVPEVDELRVLQSMLGSESYFRRMYDREAIRANLPEWNRILTQWFARGGAEQAEVAAAIEDVTRKILGADVGQANFATKITVPKAGPLQERTLDIPDALIERFLVNDPIKVARAYVRDLAPQVEMARKFGDTDMTQQLQSVSDDFAIMRKKVTDNTRMKPENKSKELDRLNQQELEAKEAIIRIRDRIMNRAGRLGPEASEGTRRAVAASRAWRNWVASARLGATALTGGTMDLAKVVATYGFQPTFKKLTQLVKSQDFRALSKSQARRVGSAVEVALSKRVQSAYDGAMTEGWSEALANGVYKWTGLNHMVDFTRTLSATLFEDHVLKAAAKVADGGTLPKWDRTRLASLGIGDDELKRIAEQVNQHGGEVDGIRISGSADWLDKELADIYDAAILKESKITVQQPGAADRVWWMDSEIGKLIGQLKSFTLSAPARLTMQPVQMAAQGDWRAARFIGYMMAGGYLAHSLRQVVAGKTPTTDPKQAAAEAITESGVLGIFPDILSPVGRRVGLGESVRYSDRNVLSAYGGPALGFAGDVYDFTMNRTQGGMSASDLHMFRRMLPYNNVWQLRRGINALEGELAEALELEGADDASFAERALRTDAVLPASQRGGTGTGVLQ